MKILQERVLRSANMANSVSPGRHFIRVSHGLLRRQERSSEKEIQYYLEIKTCDPLINGPRRKKIFLRGFRKSETQTSLLSRRD